MCENDRNDDIYKIFCDNMAELAKELEKSSKKEKRLSIIQCILIMVTVFTILMFYKYSEINFFIKEIITATLIVACCRISHKKGLETGLEIGRNTAKAKEEFNEQMVERIVKMIRERENSQ